MVYVSESSRIHVAFDSSKGVIGENKLDVVTGPNGSGKTEALSVLARQYLAFIGGHGWPDSNAQVGDDNGFGQVSRVIAQTFSPFTRFPRPMEVRSHLARVYGRGLAHVERYISVGFHSGYSFSPYGVSRRVLEEALFRLSEFTEGIEAVFGILQELAFHPQVTLTYRPGLSFSGNLFGISRFYLQRELLRRAASTGEASNLVRDEISSSSVEELATLVHKSLSIVRDNSDHFARSEHLSLRVESDTIKSKYFVFQAFSLLRRLGFLQLFGCTLVRRDTHETVDIARTSSGEQQMLCSVISLAANVRDKSLVLIDEPELSLHPRRQMEVISHLSKVMRLVKDCHFIVATHSPLVVQAAQSIGASIIQLEAGSANSFVEGKSRDMSVEQTLVDVFDTPIEYSSHISNQIFKAIVKAETGTLSDKKFAVNELENLREFYRSGSSYTHTQAMIADALKLADAAYREAIANQGRGQE